jgi:hypothetical protein
MKRVYDKNRLPVDYSVKIITSYFNPNISIPCGLCIYPYELVKTKSGRYAIVYVDHSHNSSIIRLELMRWVEASEVEKFKNMDYDELIKLLELEEGDC